jgi:beta-glucosidase
VRFTKLLPVLGAAAALAACGNEDDAGAGGGIDDRVERWLRQMTLEQKIKQMHGSRLGPVEDLYQTPDDDLLGIPGFRMVDGPRGVRAGNATTFPVGMARAATFDVELERHVGEAIGFETAAKGGNVILAPTINNLRHPRWGRAQETYGEDVCLLGEMGAAFVKGAQEHVLASVKHFAANSIEDRRMSVDVTIDERTLREIYLRPFEKVVKSAHPASVMSAYNSVNGHYCSENAHLLRDILQNDWGFDGFVESDWITGTHSTAPAALAGLAIEMPLGAYFAESKLVPAVETGEVPESVIDDAVRRILRKKLEFQLDAPKPVSPDVVESKAHTDLALAVAQEAIVLLKNEGNALPLDRATTKKLALVGPLADSVNLGDEGSSNSKPSWAVTARAGLEDRAGGGTDIVFVPGPTLSPSDLTTIGSADAAVVVVGLTADDEGENLENLGGGDRKSLDLSLSDRDLCASVAAANPRTIVVLEGSGPLIVTPFIDSISALLMAWYPGQEGGHALADVLFGDVNPSGKLPVTFPLSESQLPSFVNDQDAVSYDYLHGYRWLDHQGEDPSFPFGFGLSYTSFAYDNLVVSESGGTVQARVDVQNIGAVAGKAVAELYVSYPGSGVERAVRELTGFAKMELSPGETKTATIEFPLSDLAYFDVASERFVVEPLSYLFSAGGSSRELPVTATLDVTK